MSDIHFSADLDVSRLEKSIADSNKTVGQWAKDVEKAGGQADAGLSKVTKSFKEAITEQKALIKSIEEDVKRLQKAYDDATAGKAKSAIGGDLGSAKRSLKEEQAGLLDLQKQQIEANKAEEASTNSLTGSISKWALTLGGAAYFLNILKKALLETTGGLNAFNVLGAITQQMLYNIASGAMSFSDNIMGAIEVQKKFNALRTEEYVDSVKSAKLNNEYQQLYAESLDATLSRADKIDKIDKALKAHNDAIDIQQEHVRKSIEATSGALMNQPGSEKFLKQLSGLYVELENLEAERYQSTKRLVRQRSILIKEANDEEIKWREDLHTKLQKAADEQIEINNSISEQEKLFQKAAADGNAAEALRIKERIDLLQKELDIRINIVKAAILKDAGGVIPIITQLPGAPTVSTRPTSGSAVLSGETRVSQYIPGTAMLTDAAKAKQKEDREKETKDLKEQLETRDKILSSVTSLVMQLGQASGMDEKTLASLGTSFNIFTSALSGDWVGTVSSVLSNLISLIPNEAAKFQNQIDAINLSLKEQQRLIEQSARTGGGKETREKYIQGLEDKEKAIWKAINYAAGQGKPTDALLESLVDVRGAIHDAKQDLDDFVRGGITENTLADSIAQGFRDGKTSVDDFAGYLNTELADAITNIFTQQLLDSPQMKVFAADLKTFMEDQVLTPEEVAKLRQDQLSIVDANKANWESLNQGGIINNNAAQPGLSGQISRSITEDTASELSGLMRRMADDERKSVDFSRAGVAHLVGIEANTYGSWQELIKVNENLLNAVSDLDTLSGGNHKYVGPLG